MSHTISYAQLAIRFPTLALQAAMPDEWRFKQYEYFALLELHGDNNMTTSHPATGREVCSRRWSVLALGNSTDVTRAAIHSSIACESEALRLTGQRSTRPETYIRRWRKAIETAIPLENWSQHMITFDMGRFRANPETDQFVIEKVSALLGEPVIKDAYPAWDLSLTNPKHAAIAMLYSDLAVDNLWSTFKVSGPRFECEGLRLAT